jgi:hypothetical protein
MLILKETAKQKHKKLTSINEHTSVHGSWKSNEREEKSL